ncbi:MAG: protein translocase subunit SecD [Candidatus Marinimicrobia bacterium]|nr:protein translocase subunit SecD [Candidatus Neomarinimicrobiota bacterium]
MNESQTPRYIIIGLIFTWALYSIWPSIKFQMLSEDKKETMREEGTMEFLEDKVIRQGLDLKGGMYIVLEVDLPSLMTNLAVNIDKSFEIFISELSQQVDAPDADFFDLFKKSLAKHNLRLPRYYHEYGSNVDDIVSQLNDESEDAINRVLEILRNRVDQFGVSEPTIQKQGSSRIIVELAGIQDTERARALLQSTALLEFYLVKDGQLTNSLNLKIDKLLKGKEELEEIVSDTTLDNGNTQSVDQESLVSEDKTIPVSELFGEDESDDDTTSAVVDQRLFEDRPFSSLLRNLGGDIGVPEKNIYAVKKILSMEDVRAQLESGNGDLFFGNESETIIGPDGVEEKIIPLYHLEDAPDLTGGVIEEAREQIGSQAGSTAGQPIVLLDMNNDGAKQWSRITGANIGRRIAIVLDNKVHMAPFIREKIINGGTQIEGFADMNEAKDIAIVLRAGALPVPVNIIEERIVGPSLGADSVRQGTFSVIVGLCLVLLFMLVYYRIAGSIADLALIWNLLLVLAVLASLKATLTLPGIAALILTVGMSIDANVIIFERIREELRKGKTPRAAVDAGYSRAITAIVDANITTVIAAVVLFQFGTGPVKGFATVLFWGILISMVTAIFVTRTIFNSITKGKQLKTLSI